jgi:ribonucleotide reductase beta subunit family protein with ferritin-like domain
MTLKDWVKQKPMYKGSKEIEWKQQPKLNRFVVVDYNKYVLNKRWEVSIGNNKPFSNFKSKTLSFTKRPTAVKFAQDFMRRH